MRSVCYDFVTHQKNLAQRLNLRKEGGKVFKQKKESSKRRGPWGLLMALLLKSTKLVKVFKAIKLLKFTKVILTFATMVISAFVYSLRFGVWFGAGFVLLLFVHEMGHVFALRVKGHPWAAPIFIPMLGAVVFAPKFKDAEEEAFVGYGGPFVGGVGAFAVFLLWVALPERSELLILLSYTATFLNLFNLLPLRPLDGGRILYPLGGWTKWVGLAALLGLTFFMKEPSILLIWILTLPDLTFLDARMRFGAGVLCFVTMTTLMAMGYSHQHLWIDIMDVGIAFLFGMILYVQMRYGVPEEKEEPLIVPMGIRLKWLGLYLSLAVGLALLMIVQMPYLPAALKK